MKEMELIEYFYYNVPLSEYETKTTGIFSEKVSQIYDKFLKNGEKVLGPIVKEIMKI